MDSSISGNHLVRLINLCIILTICTVACDNESSSSQETLSAGTEVEAGNSAGVDLGDAGDSQSLDMSVSLEPRQVETTYGILEGSTVETSYGPVLSFKGIPYAQAPIGELRFKPPQMVNHWSGVKSAQDFGYSCPQTGLLSMEENQNEDCLSLNIWGPADDSGLFFKDGTARPVMVWIHGGGFVQGSGSFPLYNGARLAKRGDVLVITLNYRLGVFGFLNTRRLSQGNEVPYLQPRAQESEELYLARQESNFGIQDQILALQWIKEEIGNFGGDPNNITIFGESAGGFSVCALLSSPLAQGLFKQAIIESGGGCNGFVQLSGENSAVEQASQSILTHLNCADLEGATLHTCLEGKTTEEILDSTTMAGTNVFGLSQLGPVVDGQIIPDRTDHLLRDGRGSQVPIMIGSNADEMTLFSYNTPMNLMIFSNLLNGTFGLLSDRISALYPAETDQEARQAYNQLMSDLIFICPSLKFAATLSETNEYFAERVWVYHFEHKVLSGLPALLGATHALEIPFVFNNYHQEFYGAQANEGDQLLSDLMSDTWLQFAKTGQMNTEEITWPSYREEGEYSMIDEGHVLRWKVNPEVTSEPIRAGRCSSLNNLNLIP